MSRMTAWRNKPTTLISQMLSVVGQYKLYLVNQIGPTSFLFKDENDNKFKVIIGSTISCSCGVVQNDHCLHTLYVMMKKFKVPATNPILWQASYLDSQLQGLIHYKYVQKQKKVVHKFKHFKKKPIQSQNDCEFPPLGDDDMCPICYEQMLNDCYSTCETCHKSLHTNCFKIWIRHKQDSNVPVTCPMCRSKFNNPMLMIYNDLQKWNNLFSTHKGTICQGCGLKNIKGIIYRCLICQKITLCKLCYESNHHLDHDKYFVKQKSLDNWRIAPVRVKKSRIQFQLIKKLKINQYPLPQSNLFLINLFPTLKEYNSEMSSDTLGIVGNQMLNKQLCHKCHKLGNDNMRRLYCSHLIHDQCLKKMIEQQDYLCQIDNTCLAAGYFSAMKIEINRNKYKKNVDCKFIQNNEQQIIIAKRNKNISTSISKQKKEIKMEENAINNKINYSSKLKDRNFRILKRNINDKKQEQQIITNIDICSPIMVTGFTHQFTNIIQPQIRIQKSLKKQYYNKNIK